MRAGLLDFESLDDILQAYVLGRSSHVINRLSSTELHRIGPLTEYWFQSRVNGNGLPDVSNFPSSPASAAILTAGGPKGSSLQAKAVEFAGIPPGANPFHSPQWVAFCMRFQAAGECAGFAKKIAQAMTAAFGEMNDNVVRHSQSTHTGLAGYRWAPGEFEYVVADAGIGVLASLRSCSNYAHIIDDEGALNTALKPGESRFGKDPGHGTGFNYVFKSLMNLSGYLRFRTGTHSVIMDGQSPDLALARSAQCPPYFKGFLVSIFCQCKKIC
jgi:hypothetical protein